MKDISSDIFLGIGLALMFIGAVTFGPPLLNAREIEPTNVIYFGEPDWILWDNDTRMVLSSNNTSTLYADLHPRDNQTVMLNPNVCQDFPGPSDWVRLCVVWRGWWIPGNWSGRLSPGEVERVYQTARGIGAG